MTDRNEKRCANCSWHISGGKSGGGVCMNDLEGLWKSLVERLNTTESSANYVEAVLQ